MIEQMREAEGSVAAWALRNPYAIFAAFLAIVVGAIAAVLFLLPSRMMPYVQSPLISVITMTPGYTPQEVETYFTKPIEERMTDLRGVRYIRSYSQQGISTVTLQFHYGANMQQALVNVQQLAKQAEGELPYDRANLKPSYVVPVDPLNPPVLQLAVTGAGWDPVALRQFVANNVVADLKGVPGIQVAFPFGGLQRQIRVNVNRNALAADHLSILAVGDAIDAQNVSRSAGTITGGAYETPVRGNQLATSAQSVLNYPITTADGRTIYIRDVATVSDGPAEVRAAYRFNGKSAVELSIVQDPNASSPRVIAAVMQRIKKIEADHPGLHFARAYDNSRFVYDLTRNMLEELIVSVLLAGIVLLVFLEDVSATLIVLTTIPTCLSLAVALFVPMDLSINSSTLIGLLLAIGRLVDDSIVVIHSVHRKLDEGASPVRAAIDGTMEVIVPIAAATGVMTFAVVPLLMSGGITQIMFVGLVWPIVFALLASLLVSVTLTPLLAAYLFQQKELRSPFRTRLDGAVTRVLRPARVGLRKVDAAYRRGLAWSLDNRGMVLAGAALLTYVGISLLPFIGQEMMPLADTGQAYGFLEMDPGTSFAATNLASRRFERLLLKNRDVERVSASIGEDNGGNYFMGGPMNEVNDASYTITFNTKGQRRRSIWQIMDAIYARAMTTIPGIRRLELNAMGADVMASNSAPVSMLLYGPNRKELYHLADVVANQAKQIPGLYEVSTSSSYTQPQQNLIVDRTRASELGLTPADVQQQAYYALHGGLTTGYFNLPNVRHDTILVRYAKEQRNRTNDISAVQIVGKDGQVVPLSAIAHVERSVGPSLIEQDGLRNSVSVLGYYRRGGPGEMALDMSILTRGMAAVAFPQGYGMKSRGDMTEMTVSFKRLLGAMEVAILFIFLLLVAQFRSVIQPLVMLFAIPLQLLGMFTALLLAHQSFSTVSILGIVVANGMAVSNAILLLDLIIRKRKEGMARRDAILYAGPVRLRPILMTTIVSLIVLVPVAYFPKTGIDAYSSLASVIIGGLSISTVLTLIVVPVLHDLFDDLPEWWRHTVLRRPRGGDSTLESADA
ncbi:MAG: efflux RND transporter permease subunit [Vulcanimicrobiaceae bacterium]